MRIPFAKMHGAGNDFIMIADMEGRYLLSGATIARVCSRRRGIGGDGLIVLRPGTTGDFSMRYYNSDGGEADLCGNGARCAAAFALESGIAGTRMTFDTRSGVVGAEIVPGGVRVSIGSVRALKLGMRIGSTDRPVHYGVCGVPHAVVVMDDVRALTHDEFVRFAAPVRRDPGFGAAGANVDIVSVTDRRACEYRTYERGVEDETEACGTGAVVIAAILTHLGLVDPPVRCLTRGNDILDVALELTSDGAASCLLAGPVITSFRGTFDSESYEHQ
jgi:diaminopimelate epimerase